jgi:hypothetical protein
MLQSLTRAVPFVTRVVEVAFRDDSERTDRRECSALGTIDLVHTVAVADQLASVSAWEIQILREHIVGFVIADAVGNTATAASAWITHVAPLSTTG